jgi:hypothetical protein
MKCFQTFWIVLIFIACTSSIFPCDISFKLSDLKAVKGKETTVTVFVRLRHRNCVLPLSKTVFLTEGVTIQKKGTWDNVKDNLYKISLSIMPIQTNGHIQVIRECGRKGTIMATLKVST